MENFVNYQKQGKGTRFCRGQQLHVPVVERGWCQMMSDWGNSWRCPFPSHSFLSQLGWSRLTSSPILTPMKGETGKYASLKLESTLSLSLSATTGPTGLRLNSRLCCCCCSQPTSQPELQSLEMLVNFCWLLPLCESTLICWGWCRYRF